MRRLQDEAVFCLKSEFPSSLSGWSCQDFGNVIYEIDSAYGGRRPTTSLFEILYLAHEHSVTSILPALYLRICLTHNAVSRVVMLCSHIYLNLCIISRKKSPRVFNVLQKNCP